MLSTLVTEHSSGPKSLNTFVSRGLVVYDPPCSRLVTILAFRFTASSSGVKTPDRPPESPCWVKSATLVVRDRADVLDYPRYNLPQTAALHCAAGIPAIVGVSGSLFQWQTRHCSGYTPRA